MALDRRQLKALGDYFKSPVKDPYKWGQFGYKAVLEDGREYHVFEDSDDAEYAAKESLSQTIHDSPDYFDEQSLKGYVTMKLSAKKQYAQEAAEDYVDSMNDEELLQSAGMEVDKDSIREGIRRLQKHLTEAEDPETEKLIYKELLSRKKLLQRGGDVEKAKLVVIDSIFESTMEMLDDPLHYFIHEMSQDLSDVLNMNGIYVDYDQFIDDLIQVHGVAGELSIYDGQEHEIDGMYAYRYN